MPGIKGSNSFCKLSVFALLITSFLITGSIAQGFHFGRNKVQYTPFDWQVLKTKHFDIYYYPEMKDLAEKGARFAEESYSVLETKFNYSVARRIPLIFYSSHLHFQQTNVTPGFIPEGVGGFFEFMKGRVVIPSNGDLYSFKHVIRHELVHVFMHGKIIQGYNAHNQIDASYPPLWFVEGLAEFWSTSWDAKGEMVLKDAVLNNYVVGLEGMNAILGTFTMYKVGQDILEYISANYGEDKILLMLENLWKHDHFEDCFKEVLGMNYRQFDKEYLYNLKKRFYPLLADEDYNDQVDETIVRDGYNFKPVFYRKDNTDYVVFLGNKTGYSSIYMRPMEPLQLNQDEDEELLIKGEASSDFEAFHIFDSKIDVNQDGLLTFTSKSGETDVLYIFDINSRKIISKHKFENLVGILSPSWSPDGSMIAFSGLNISGYKDIYLLYPETGKLVQLTNDIYDDNDPSWSPDGKYLTFSSDRTDFGVEGAANIFLMNVDSGQLYFLTYGKQTDHGPVFSPNGKYIAYTSDYTGSDNIYLLKDPIESIKNTEPVKMLKMSSYVGSTFDPAWTDDGGLLYGTFESMRFQIRLNPDFINQIDEAEIIKQDLAPNKNRHWTYANLSDSKIEARKPYVNKYDLDFAQTQVAQDPIFGTSGGALLSFTDLLGNDQYYFLLYNNARTTSDFWKSFNVAVTKVSLGDRVNYALGVFRFAGYYYNPQDAYYYEENIGTQFVVSYPLSQFTRIDYNQTISYSDKDWFFQKRRQAYLNSSYISFVHDNSIWTYTGPIDGERINITFGNTFDFAFSQVGYLTGLIDLRKYFRTSRRTAYAVRLLSLFNEGKEIRQFYFGGSWDLRGYQRWSLRGKRIFLLSQELRFPMIDLVGLRFPFGSIGFNAIAGALFVDAGNAWNDEWDGLKGSFGLSIKFPLANVLVLRWDIGRKTDFKTISGYTFSHFFFGWDF
jgi:hypothetical protein